MRLSHSLILSALFMLCAAQIHAQEPAVPAAAARVSVPVLDHAIAKGDLLSAGDFTTQDVAETVARTLPRAKDVIGMEAARALPAGAMVRSTDVIRPQLVRRGEPVTIALRDGGLSITTQGRALSGGAAGDFVRVVSLSTNHTLDGVVEGTGAVRVAAK
ncbi:flagellar basal body P-ring formation chaperone FlgA [Sphingomonas sp. MMS24-J45]|uniref:flagellar basal body P-ring formation chaperone FlgA n=1 Tax=Sphingomonas sp. MMS24-J45 TaxID=3238806 RepID=UPI00384BF4CC